MGQNSISPTDRVNQLYWGFVISRAIHVAARLGIADHVNKQGTPVSSIAKALHLNEDRTYRLMRLLASYEIFNESQKKIFQPTELSDTIKSTTEGSIRSAAHLVTKSMWEAFGHLEHSVETGKDCYTDLYGKGVFDYLDEHPIEANEFDNAMHNYATFENPVLAKILPLNSASTLVDIAGGQGGFLQEILKHHNQLKGTLFDQPFVVDQAIFKSADSEFKERASIVGGNFFEAVPSGADVYVMKRILHDWSNDDCVRILKTCRAAMKDDSRLFIIDAIVPDGNSPHFSKDLEVFLMTWGGNERDRVEFDTLFASVDMKINSVTEAETLLSIIEVIKC